MEEHQQKKRDVKNKDKRSKDEKIKSFMLREFDREKDLKPYGMESGATFKIVNNNNLDKKFAPSRSSYM
jgi:hypothetical protein